MYKKKFFFIVFEGIEGSGKSYISKKLYKRIKSIGLPVVLTREPGGSIGAEKIRDLILKDYFYSNKINEFDKYTDTLLYLAARNEHIKKKIIPAIKNKQIVICDRYIDSTLAYQAYGKGVNKQLINSIHKHILGKAKPDITFLLTVKINKAMKRLKLRKKINRYDKFSNKFYIKTQKAFVKIAKKNKKKYFIFDNSNDKSNIEDDIFRLVKSKLTK